MSSPTTRSRPRKGSKSKKKSPKRTTSRTGPAPGPRQRLFGIALGSNLGDSATIFRQAISALARRLGPLRVAYTYLTEPVSPLPQPAFLNTVVVGRTGLAAAPLLALLHETERRFGRERRSTEPAGGPRTLDLDLLFLGKVLRRRRPPLLPHPRLRARRFVLAPLADLVPDLPLPPDGRTVAELLARLPARPWVRRAPAPASRGR